VAGLIAKLGGGGADSGAAPFSPIMTVESVMSTKVGCLLGAGGGGRLLCCCGSGLRLGWGGWSACRWARPRLPG
jgi:hypothetical protein